MGQSDIHMRAPAIFFYSFMMTVSYMSTFIYYNYRMATVLSSVIYSQEEERGY